MSVRRDGSGAGVHLRRGRLYRSLGDDVENRCDADQSDAPEAPLQDAAAGLGRGLIAHMTDDSSDAPKTPAQRGQAMWGGRFTEKPAELMQAINVSIGFDRRLAAQDLAGSRAHAAMLRKVGVISSDDEAAIQQGLQTI